MADFAFEIGVVVHNTGTGTWARTGTVTRRYGIFGYPELYEVAWHEQAGRVLEPPIVCRGYAPAALLIVEQGALL